MQSSLGKTSALLGSRVTKASGAGSSSGKSPSASARKDKKPRKASGSWSAKKTTDGLSSGNDNIYVYSV